MQGEREEVRVWKIGGWAGLAMTFHISSLRGALFVLRLICYPIIGVAVLLAAKFDWSFHRVEVFRSHQQAPGDFLVFRGAALLAMHPDAKVGAIAASLPYPPPFLLLAAPFAWLPTLPGYCIWVIVSVGCLIWATKMVGYSWPEISLGLLAQPTLFCIMRGQSGILISAFVLLALGLVDVQPIAAGLAAGAIIAKPQLGLLIPVCYLGARKFRAVFAGSASVATFCAAATLSFGVRIWRDYEARPLSAAKSMLTASWPQKFQVMMVTPMVMLRSLGVDFDTAGIAQAVITVGAGLACYWLWWQRFSAVERLAPTLCLMVLATPYSYVYDMPALGIALAAFAFAAPLRGLLALTLFFAFTSVYALLSYYYFSTGAIFLSAVLLLVWPRPPAARGLCSYSAVLPHAGGE